MKDVDAASLGERHFNLQEIRKALKLLEHGTGEILVLLSLQ